MRCPGQNLPTAANKVFVNAYKAKYNGDLPGVFAERGWVTARVIVEALKKTKGNTADRAALLSAIRTVKFPAPRGTFTFDPVTQNVINPMYVRQVVRGPNGLYNKFIAQLGMFQDPGK